MSKSNYLETQLLNHVLRNTAYPSPTSVYMALYLVAPTEAGGGTEMSGDGYVRQAVTFSAPAPDSCTNTADITFPIATGDWGTIVAFGIFDQAAAGNLLYSNNLTAPREILTSDQFRVPSGQLLVSED